MTTFTIIADSHNTFGLRNETTGQIDHGGFSSIKWVRSFWRVNMAWNPSVRLEG